MKKYKTSSKKPEVIRSLKIQSARLRFWDYCRLLMPEFYKDDRIWLRNLCDKLQTRPKRLIINIPPRHGKSLTLSLFETWVLGQNSEIKILTVSYNDTIASRFSKSVRETIDSKRVDSDNEQFLFSDVFPNVKIKKGDGSAQLWALEGNHFNYLGCGMGATITGLGADLGIIDDPVKNAKESYSERVLDEHWDFFQNTFLSRIESGGSIIINHTRWNENDLAGRLIKQGGWEVFSLALEQNGKPLCSEIMSLQEMREKKKTMDPKIWEANYNQRIIETSSRFYQQGFKLIDEIEKKLPRMAVFDVADKGSDFTAGICFVKNGDYFDVADLFQDSSELIELEDRLIEWLKRNEVKIVHIEGNSFGNYFSKTLKKKVPEIVVRTFNSRTNKEARIRSASFYMQDRARFHRSLIHTDFYKVLISFDIESAKNDDQADAFSSIYHIFNKKSDFHKTQRI